MGTKYKVGDEVWYDFFSEPRRTTIRRTFTMGKRILYVPEEDCPVSNFREEEIFPTKEELIEMKIEKTYTRLN